MINAAKYCQVLWRCSGLRAAISVIDSLFFASEVPQKGPVITPEYLDSMEEGDRVWVNCSAYRSRPAAQLTWYINGARVSERG